MSLTTAKAAELCGMTPAVFRAHMTRERAKGNDMRQPPDEWPDKRTPIYDEEGITKWIAKRAQR